MKKETPILNFLTFVAFNLSFIFSYQVGGLWAAYANGMLVLSPIMCILFIGITLFSYVLGEDIPYSEDISVSLRDKSVQWLQEWSVFKNAWTLPIRFSLQFWLFWVMTSGGYVFGTLCLVSALIMRWGIIPYMKHAIIKREEERCDSDDDYDFDEEDTEE